MPGRVVAVMVAEGDAVKAGVRPRAAADSLPNVSARGFKTPPHACAQQHQPKPKCTRRPNPNPKYKYRVACAGAPLVALEAMKMEHRVVAPRAGVVESVLAAPGQQVAQGQVMVVMRPEGQAAAAAGGKEAAAGKEVAAA